MVNPTVAGALAVLTLGLAACGGGSGANAIPENRTSVISGSVPSPTPTPTTASPTAAPSATPSATPTATPLSIAVIGDSVSRIQILPDSAVPCGAPVGNVPACDFSTDGSKAWPAMLAQQIGATVVDLASSGARTVEPFAGTTAVIDQVPGIPTNANAVVIESGTNDTSAHGAGPQYASDIGAVVSAVKARAPNARLIFVGVRYFWQPTNISARVDLWNANLAAQGTFVDLRSLWPAGVGPDWPDGTHPGPNAVAAIARMVAAAL